MSATEINSGWRHLLTKSLVYRLVQFVFSEKRSKQLILHEFILPIGQNCRVLDIGCGPGNLPNFLPEYVDYIGFDASKEYIESAQQKYFDREKVRFIFASTEEMMGDKYIPENSIDVAIVHGVFHHVTDSIARQMFDLAGKKLVKGGRMVVLEPVWFSGQSQFRKWVMAKDRGKNIKTEQNWNRFISDSTVHWADYSCTVEQNLIRFYDLIVCRLTKR